MSDIIKKLEAMGAEANTASQVSQQDVDSLAQPAQAYCAYEHVTSVEAE